MVAELEVKKIPLELIKFDDTNPNELSNEQMESLKLTMEKFGYLAPVILNKDLTVIDGEHRVKIYQELGKKEIQAYVIDVDTIDLKILRQLMNKLRGEHDKQKDSLEFKSIYDAGKLEEFSKLLAQPRESFEAILSRKFDIDFIKEEQEIPQINRDTDVKLGDVYQLGDHRVMCGDSTIDLDKLLGDKTVDLLLTDPPYGVDYSSKNRFLNTVAFGYRIEEPILNDAIDDYVEWFSSWLSKIPFSEYNSFYITISGQKLYELITALQNNNFKISQHLVWVKNNHVLGRQDYANKHELIIYGWKDHHKFYGDFQTSVWEVNKPLKNEMHPTMKPIELMTKAIINSSKENMIILDPFLGSGSTLIACEASNRICHGMELDPYYVDVIIKRWENYTGKKAVKISSNTQ